MILEAAPELILIMFFLNGKSLYLFKNSPIRMLADVKFRFITFCISCGLEMLISPGFPTPAALFIRVMLSISSVFMSEKMMSNLPRSSSILLKSIGTHLTLSFKSALSKDLDMATIFSRITSYNVCYTKLLRIYDISLQFFKFGILFQINVNYVYKSSVTRITSYNVCYTKLLRYR